MPGDYLKHRFISLTEVTFWAGQQEINDFKVPWEHLKHRFIDFTQVEFWAYPEAEIDF